MLRIRLTVAAALVAMATVVGVGGLGGVADAKPTKDGKECIDRLEKGADPKDCHEAPSPILPATNEIVWGAISFAVLFFALSRFAFPALKKSLAARTERIRGSLDEAEQTRTEAQRVLDEYRSQLADARGESARIIEEARQAADAMRRDLMAGAEADAAAARERGQADIQAAIERATADLRAQMAQLSVQAAEMVIQRSLSDRELQVQLVEDYINSVARQRG